MTRSEDTAGSAASASRPGEGAGAFANEVACLLDDRHCADVQVLDLRGISQVCDYLVIGSGSSERQMRSIASEVGELGRDRGYPRFRTNNDAASTWVVVDFIDLVVHLFEPSRRAYYDLEDLWSDATRVEHTRTGGKS